MTGLLFQTLQESHKHAIAITLALLDESICQFEEWACSRQIRSVLYLEVNTLSSDQQEKIRLEVSEMRNILLELRDILGLAANTRVMSDTIRSQCHGHWIYLTELAGSYLRGYGEPPTGLVEYLEPRIQQLIQHTIQLIATVTEK
jgi:hypothetical protein